MREQKNVTFSNISVVLNNSFDYSDSSAAYDDFYHYSDCEEPKNFTDVLRNTRFVTVILAFLL